MARMRFQRLRKGKNYMVSATAALAVTAQWNNLSDYLNKWFYKTDTQAMACAMSCAAAHYYLDAVPVWLFVVGPSSSGKTRICIDSFDGAPAVWPMGDITAKTFISGNPKYSGLLGEMGKHGILTFKDFTTILSKREDERGEIAAQLREIYDGKFTKRTGMAHGGTWMGKVTVLAGATTALEKAWAIRRELGERFLTVRWPTTSDYQGLRLAAKQRGRDPEITRKLRELVGIIIQDRALDLPDVPDEMTETIAAYSQILARMRGQVIRDASRQITDHPVVEDSYRIHKQLCTAAAAHAALWHRLPGPEDLAIAKRLALDSIPLSRRMIFNALLPMAALSTAEICQFTLLPDSTADYHLEDLTSLGVINTLKSNQKATSHSFCKEFIEDLKLAEVIG
jgi:hypothetical protein